MKQDTLIEHKEVVIVVKKVDLYINSSYNVLLTTPKDNTIVKSIVPFVMYNEIYITLH
jgi:hypothetical protein